MKKIFLFATTCILTMTMTASAQTTYRKTWVFTNWSEQTITNLKAEAAYGASGGQWSDIEKANDTEATVLSAGNCFWEVTAHGNATNGSVSNANGEAIEELEGLIYTNTYDRSLAIAVNYGDCSSTNGQAFGPYHGASYLWLGSSKKNYFIIPHVAPGSTITMGVESHKTTETRGVELYVGSGTAGTRLLDEDGNEVPLPTTYQDLVWYVPENLTDTPNDDGTYNIQIYNTNGCHIYYITVDGDDVTIAGNPTTDKLYINDFSISADEQKQVSVMLDNSEHEYVAIQFDLILPNGISIAKDSQGEWLCNKSESRMGSNLTMSLAAVSTDVYRFVIFSLSNIPISGTSGSIVEITLEAATNAELDNVAGSIENILMVTSDEVSCEPANTTFGINGPPQLTTPIIEVDSNGNVRITCSDTDAGIFYTLDGTTPTIGSALYTVPFLLTKNCIVKAIAVAEGYVNSEVATYAVDWLADSTSIVYVHPDEMGLSTSAAVRLEAGTPIGSLSSMDVAIATPDDYYPWEVLNQMQFYYPYFYLNDEKVSKEFGIWGQNNPKDANGRTPGISLNVPATGCSFSMKAKKDGYMYVWGSFSTAKAYSLFEDSVAVGYRIAMITDGWHREGDTNNLGHGRVYLQYGDFHKALTKRTPDISYIITGDSANQVNVYGEGVMVFPVRAGSNYIMLGNGCKFMFGGVHFNETLSSTIKLGDADNASFTVLAPGDEPDYYSETTDSITLHIDTVTTFSSPSFTAMLTSNGGTAQYIGSSYYRLGGGGSLTLRGKRNVTNIVSVKMNLQDPARSGSDVTASSGTVIGDSITDVNATSLTITANGSWPQLWLSSLTVTYEGTEPTGTYAIRLPQYMAYGTVTSDTDWADEGDVVTLTATADADCHLTHLYANRGAVTLTPSATSADQYTFTMPAEDVTIGAVFAEGGITTGVLLNVPEDGGTAATDKKTPVYNLQGQRLIRLRTGINIVGGKKVIGK